jgi:hypothetical protein
MIDKKFRFDVKLHDEADDMEKREEAARKTDQQQLLRVNQRINPQCLLKKLEIRLKKSDRVAKLALFLLNHKFVMVRE